MQKLVIGCGYLGLRVAREWLLRGDEVWALTRSAARAAEFAELGMQPVIGDVLDPISLRQLPRVTTVLYAVGFDRTSQTDKRTVYVDGLSNVLREVGTTCERFLDVSSTSVYGQCSGEWVDESSPTMPTEEGGRICLEAEAAVRQLKPEAIVLRLAGIYGPGRLLARLDQFRRGERLTGNPQAWLNLIHVEDAMAAVLAAETHGELGKTYLVCDDRPLPRREYYELLAKAFAAPLPQFAELSEDAPELCRFNKRCANRRLREELNVTLRYPTVSDGLKSLAEATR